MNSVSRLRDLLAPVTAEGDDYDVYTWVTDDGQGLPAEHLRHLLVRMDFLTSPDKAKELGVPITVEDLATCLIAVPVEEAAPLMMSILTENLVSQALSGPLTEDRADPVVQGILETLGPEARWLTNVHTHGDRFGAWERVTSYTFDRVVVGSGKGAQVGMLAIAED